MTTITLDRIDDLVLRLVFIVALGMMGSCYGQGNHPAYDAQPLVAAASVFIDYFHGFFS